MPYDQVKQYITSRREQGASDEEIRQALSQSGWEDIQISQAFAAADGTPPPPPPSPEKSSEKEFEATEQRQLPSKAFWLLLFSTGSKVGGSILGLTGVLVYVALQLLSSLNDNQGGGNVFDAVFEGIWGPALLSIPLIGIAILVGWIHLFRKSIKYQLAEEVYKSEWGVIWKNYTSIPYRRIQNVDIKRGLLARLLGLSVIQIQTAGDASHQGAEGRLTGLLKQDAEELREILVERSRKAQGEF